MDDRRSRRDRTVFSGFIDGGAGLVWAVFSTFFLLPMLILSGLVTSVIASIALSSTLSLVLNAQSATGTVVEVVSRRSDESSLLYPVFEFSDAGEVSHRIESDVGTVWERYNKGDSVRVLYDPLAPDEARIDSFLNLWATPVIAGGLALVHVFAAVFIILRRRARRRRLNVAANPPS